MKFIFWHTNKHGSILQFDTIILDVCNQACPKYQNKKFTYLCIISQKAWGMKLIFFACR